MNPAASTDTAPKIVTVPRMDIFNGVQPAPPGIEYRIWDLSRSAEDEFGAEEASRIVMVCWPYPDPDPAAAGKLLEQLPNLQLVQVMSIGYEKAAEAVPANITISNAGGVHATSTSEFALTLILAKRRGIDVAVNDARNGHWETVRRPSLADSKVLIIGSGSIGTAIYDRLVPFEVEITRVARTSRTDDRGPIHGMTEIPDLLPKHDIVVLIVPQTSETVGMVDAQFLSAMKEGALLVNVGRGPLVDTDALLEALRSNKIQAALDVTDPEPLPADHPLWSEPNVLITPHLGGSSTAGPPRLHKFLSSQIRLVSESAEPASIVRSPQTG